MSKIENSGDTGDWSQDLKGQQIYFDFLGEYKKIELCPFPQLHVYNYPPGLSGFSPILAGSPIPTTSPFGSFVIRVVKLPALS